MRHHAHAVRADVIANLDRYLEQFHPESAGQRIIVHRAADAAEAVGVMLEIATRIQTVSGAPVLVAKSKSMVSEEIHFNLLSKLLACGWWRPTWVSTSSIARRAALSPDYTRRALAPPAGR